MNEFIYPLRVYYEDTDFSGIVYHANYLKYIERGRSEWLRYLGIEQTKLIEQGFAFAVTELTIKYLKPAKFDDELEVVTGLESSGKASMTFKQYIRSKQQPELIYCQAQVKVAYINVQSLKPKALPKQLLEEIICAQ